MRTNEVAPSMAGANYVAAKDVPTLLNEFMNWYNLSRGKIHPIQLAAQAYQRLVSIHPFSDGNGRTCRLVMDYILLREGLPPPTLGADGIEVAYFGEATDEGNPNPEDVVFSVTAGVKLSVDLLFP